MSRVAGGQAASSCYLHRQQRERGVTIGLDTIAPAIWHSSAAICSQPTVKIKIISRASHARSPLPFFSIEIIIILITCSNGCISRLSSNFLRRPRTICAGLGGARLWWWWYSWRGDAMLRSDLVLLTIYRFHNRFSQSRRRPKVCTGDYKTPTCPSLTIIASANQFHVYLPWGQRLFDIVSLS